MATLAPFLVPQVGELRAFRELQFQVEECGSATGLPGLQDRVTVGVPCCSRHVQWHVLYDASCPTDAPDVIFPEGEESFQPLVDDNDEGLALPPSPSSSGTASSSNRDWALLRDWPAGDSTRLLKLILTLRRLYLQHHWALAEAVDDPRVRFELSTLGHTPGTEVLVVQGGEWGQRRAEEVLMAVPLQPLDLSPLAPFKSFSGLLAQQQNQPRQHQQQPGSAAPFSSSTSSILAQPKLVLQLKFPVGRGTGNGNASTQLPQVSLDSPRLLQSLLSLSDFQLPPWAETTCVIEYEPLVRGQLQAKIAEVAMGMQARAAFLAAIVPYFGTPLESDAVLFLRSTLLLSLGSFTFLLHILLSPKFPRVQPSLQLQSTQHFDASGRPVYSQVFDAYPWSPRWEAPEMVRRIGTFLVDECPRFKAQCG